MRFHLAFCLTHFSGSFDSFRYKIRTDFGLYRHTKMMCTADSFCQMSETDFLMARTRGLADDLLATSLLLLNFTHALVTVLLYLS